MRHYFTLFIFCILFSYGFAAAQDIPEPMSPPRLVNDFCGILSKQQNTELERKLRYYHDSTSTQIYVVIVPSFNGYDKAMFAIELGEKWGIGQEGKDNGAVLLVKPKSGNEKGEVFISTGYGLEATLTDALCRRIVEKDIIPYFRENNYYKGIDAGVDRMMEILSGQFEGDGGDYYIDGVDIFLNIIIALALILFVVVYIKSGGGGFTSGGRRISTTSSSSSGRSSSGGGRSSMPKFGGGGGGRFGGGGAGGSW